MCVCNVCTIYRYQLPCIYIVHGNFTSQFQRTNQSQISNNGMVQLLTTAGTPRERPFKRNKCHRPKSFIQKYRPCKVESLNTRFKCVTLLQIGSYNLDLTGAQKLPGPSSALPTEVSTSTWDPWASKTGRFGGCTHQLPRVSEALAEHSLSDLCSTSRGFQMSQRPSQLRTLGENEIIYVW